MSRSSKDVGLFPVAQPITAGDFTPDPEGPELPPGLPGGIPGHPGLPESFLCQRIYTFRGLM